MLLDIYETTLGKHNKQFKSKVEKELLEYITISGDDLSYEYTGITSGKILFITGKNEEEKRISSFPYPILTKDLKDNDIVFVDVRSGIRIKDLHVESIKSITRDVGFIKFITIQSIFMLKLKDKEILQPIKQDVIKGLSGWITSAIGNGLMLNSVEKSELNAIVIDYVINIVDGKKDASLKEHMIGRLNLFGKLREDRIEDLLRDLNRDATTIKELISNIKESDLKDRLARLNYDTIYSLITQTMFGNIIKESTLVAMEHVPTWLGLLYIADTNRLYQKTSLAFFLKVSNKTLSVKDTISFIDRIVNESQVSLEDYLEDTGEAKVEMIKTSNHSLFKNTNANGVDYVMYIGDFMDNDTELHGITNELLKSNTNDTIKFIINSSGGIVTQGKLFWNIINNMFAGRNSAFLNIRGYSMGALVFSMCEERVVSEVSEIMYHNYSGGVIGDGGNMKDKIDHNEKSIVDFSRTILIENGFLSEDEFSRMLDGKEHWFRTEEMCDRGIATHVIYKGIKITAKEYLKKIRE